LKGKNRKNYSFVVDSVARTEKEEKVLISWEGKELGIKGDGKEEIVIPALGDFKVVDIKVVQSPEQYIQLLFQIL
jgi:hypothetical protein